MKHKWWHFIYGKDTDSELVSDYGNVRTTNYWDVCKKCGVQIGKKQGCTTVSFELEIRKKSPTTSPVR